jgi:hypothetical protein
MDPTLFAIRKARCTRFRWMIYFLALFVIVTVVERCVYYPETVLGTNQFDDMLVYLHRTDQYHKVSAAELGEQTPSSALYLVELIWESSSRADHLGLWGVIKRHEWEVRCVQEFNADIRRLHYNKTRAGDVMPYPPDLSQWSVAIAEYTGDSDSGRAMYSGRNIRYTYNILATPLIIRVLSILISVVFLLLAIVAHLRYREYIVRCKNNQCVACGYMLKNSSASQCPECGHPIAKHAPQHSTTP